MGSFLLHKKFTLKPLIVTIRAFSVQCERSRTIYCLRQVPVQKATLKERMPEANCRAGGPLSGLLSDLVGDQAKMGAGHAHYV